MKGEGKKELINYPNGDRYRGTLKDGKPDGHGIFTYSN
jgi:hypothetical protein